MSYTVPDQQPSRQRPAVVTVSSALLFLVAAIYVIGFLILVPQIGAVSDAYEEIYAGTEFEGSETVGTFIFVGAGAFTLLLAGGLAVLAIFNNRGKNPSRIVTWVVAGVLLCCLGFGLAAQGLMSGIEVDSGTGPTQSEVEDALADALPGWYGAWEVASTVISALALVGAIVLLLLPASNEFFRKPPEVFEPPQYPPPPPGGGTPPPGTTPPPPGGAAPPPPDGPSGGAPNPPAPPPPPVG